MDPKHQFAAQYVLRAAQERRAEREALLAAAAMNINMSHFANTISTMTTGTTGTMTGSNNMLAAGGGGGGGGGIPCSPTGRTYFLLKRFNVLSYAVTRFISDSSSTRISTPAEMKLEAAAAAAAGLKGHFGCFGGAAASAQQPSEYSRLPSMASEFKREQQQPQPGGGRGLGSPMNGHSQSGLLSPTAQQQQQQQQQRMGSNNGQQHLGEQADQDRAIQNNEEFGLPLRAGSSNNNNNNNPANSESASQQESVEMEQQDLQRQQRASADSVGQQQQQQQQQQQDQAEDESAGNRPSSSSRNNNTPTVEEGLFKQFSNTLLSAAATGGGPTAAAAMVAGGGHAHQDQVSPNGYSDLLNRYRLEQISKHLHGFAGQADPRNLAAAGLPAFPSVAPSATAPSPSLSQQQANQ